MSSTLAPPKLSSPADLSLLDRNRNATGGTAAPLTIGIRDSGVGGLTVACEIKKKLPHARLLYFADTAHVPYGDRTPREVRHLALAISEFLIGQGAQLVVFACNTSSAYALQIAKNRFEAPLIGMIEPGARAALAANAAHPERPIGVLATAATVNSRMYARWIEGLQDESGQQRGAPCIEVACPQFVPLVESEQANSSAARRAAEEYLRPVREAGARAVVLGCTHYPLLLPILREIAPEIRFVDPAHGVAAEAVAALGVASDASLAMQQGNAPVEADRFFVSGAQDGVRGWVASVLGNHQPDIATAPVFTPPIEQDDEPLQEIE